MNPEDYVSHPLALALKKAGFDYPCYFYYTRKDAPDDHVWSTTSEEAPIDYNRSVYAGCSMPTLAQAQKWLREKKRLIVLVDYILITKDAANRWCFSVSSTYGLCDTDKDHKRYNSYEAALSAGIEAALELRGNKISKEAGL